MDRGLDTAGGCSEGSGAAMHLSLTCRGIAEPTWAVRGVLELPVAGKVSNGDPWQGQISSSSLRAGDSKVPHSLGTPGSITGCVKVFDRSVK